VDKTAHKARHRIERAFFYERQTESKLMNTPIKNDPANQELRKRNLRMALILASVAAVFFIGFIAKYVWLSR
jgi:hypothetical protein